MVAKERHLGLRRLRRTARRLLGSTARRRGGPRGGAAAIAASLRGQRHGPVRHHVLQDRAGLPEPHLLGEWGRWARCGGGRGPGGVPAAEARPGGRFPGPSRASGEGGRGAPGLRTASALGRTPDLAGSGPGSASRSLLGRELALQTASTPEARNGAPPPQLLSLPAPSPQSQ